MQLNKQQASGPFNGIQYETDTPSRKIEVGLSFNFPLRKKKKEKKAGEYTDFILIFLGWYF